jgi:hypothetical protein
MNRHGSYFGPAAYEPLMDQIKPHQMKIPVAIAIMTLMANL